VVVGAPGVPEVSPSKLSGAAVFRSSATVSGVAKKPRLGIGLIGFFEPRRKIRR